MARNRQRACLQDGLFLNLPWLLRNGYVLRARQTPERPISWSLSNFGIVASGLVCADLSHESFGWLKVMIAETSQEIRLISQPRNFGGRQWYLVCPVTGRRVSVLWKPPGAKQFACRHAWPNQVAYLSQFGSRIDRAHLGKARIRARLASHQNAEGWEIPPRPSGMRIRTYNELAKRFRNYQGVLNVGIATQLVKFPSTE